MLLLDWGEVSGGSLSSWWRGTKSEWGEASEEESEPEGELMSKTACRAHEVDGIGTVAMASGYVAGRVWKGVVVDMVVIVGVGRGEVEEDEVVVEENRVLGVVGGEVVVVKVVVVMEVVGDGVVGGEVAVVGIVEVVVVMGVVGVGVVGGEVVGVGRLDMVMDNGGGLHLREVVGVVGVGVVG